MMIVLMGRVVSGSGKARTFLSMSQYVEKIKEKVGFTPFPGTLNIELEQQSVKKRKLMNKLKPIVVSGFESGGKNFGGLHLYKAQVTIKEKTNGCVVVVPEKSEYGLEILEVIAEIEFRKECDIKEGDLIEVTVFD